MILVIDIGNTNIHIGASKTREVEKELRFSTPSSLTPYECFLMVRELRIKNLKGAVIGSVVPPLTDGFKDMLESYYSIKALLVEPKKIKSLKFRYKDPSTIGADRIANAIGAIEEYKRDVIIVDFGTATTLDVVTREGVYLGGVIVPGVESSLKALISKTAKLPEVEIVIPERCIGENTEECIQSGLFFSLLGGLEKIIEKIEGETGRRFFVIATGGLSKRLGSKIPIIDKIDPLLTLKGLLCIYYESNKG